MSASALILASAVAFHVAVPSDFGTFASSVAVATAAVKYPNSVSRSNPPASEIGSPPAASGAAFGRGLVVPRDTPFHFPTLTYPLASVSISIPV